MIRFRILGTVEVEGESGPVDIRGSRRRALLVRLLLSANQPVPADRIAEDVWDGDPPRGAASTLTSHVSLLRQLLGSDRISNRAGGYTLRVGPGELDVADFESDVHHGHAALYRGDPQVAAECLQRGLDRWRGSALADVEEAAWAQGAIARLHELRLTAQESLLEAGMGLGRHREVVAAAQSAVEAEPLREQRWATLMLALYRSGRQADALRTFQRLRRHLDDELGLEPSPTLCSLEESIILHRPELDWTPSATLSPAGAAAPGVVTPGAGVVLVAELRGGGAGTGRGDHGRTGAGPPRDLVRDALVRHGGRELTLPGAEVAASFTNPSGALAAAVAMQQAQARYHHRAASDVSVRIGMASGELTVVDGELRGGVVDEAGALCRAAATGEILVAGPLAEQAGRRWRADFTPRDPVAVDGEGGPAPVLALGWEPLEEDPVDLPLPEALHYPYAEYVGRGSQVAQLGRAFERAAAGERQVAIVGGEPGIGKTALTAVVAQAVEEAGGSVLYGRCLDPGAPYQPFLDSLGHYVRFAPRHELEAHVAAYGGEVTRLVPALAHRVPEAPAPSASDPDTERYLAFTAAIGLLAEACRHRPVLLVLDDLHWADQASLALLRQLVTASAGLPLLVIGTFRSSDVAPDDPLSDTLAALWREPGVSRLDLAGLTFDDVLDLCVAMAGHQIEDLDLVTDLQRDTGGNPFFVRELLRHMVEAGALVQDDDTERWFADRSRLSSGLPSSLREVIGERVRHLGPEGPPVLALASVIGARFELSVLARAAESEEELLLDLLEQAERSALLIEEGDGGTFSFAHVLTRHTLYDGLGPTRRRRLHARVASALEQEAAGPPAAALLAYHFTEAGEPVAALHYAELAGYDALNAMAPSEAARWFEAARTLLEVVQPDDAQRRCDFTIQLGLAQLLAGDPAHRVTLLEAGTMADAAGDVRRMAVAALANSRGYYSAAGQTDHERLAALRRALECLGSADGQLRVRLLGALCSESVFETPLSERVDQVNRAVDEARALDDPLTLLTVLNLGCEPLRHPSGLAQRLDHTEQALGLARQVDDPAATFWAVTNRMQTLIEAGAVPEAEELFGDLTTIAGEVGHPVMRWMAVFAGAQWSLLRGETATGEAQAEEALAVGQALGQPDAFNYFATQISHARWQQGRLDELVELIEIGARDNPGIPAYQGALARALLQAGRHDEARSLLDKATDAAFADPPEDLLWSYGLSTYAEVAIQLDHHDSAAVLYDHLCPFDEHLTFVGTACEGPIAHYLGGLCTVLGRFDAAEHHLEVASALATRAGSPFYETRTMIEQGRLAGRRGDGEAARRLLSGGCDLAGRWGFAGEERRARHELAQLV